jgi:Protein of unknown function (DUF3082)
MLVSINSNLSTISLSFLGVVAASLLINMTMVHAFVVPSPKLHQQQQQFRSTPTSLKNRRMSQSSSSGGVGTTTSSSSFYSKTIAHRELHKLYVSSLKEGDNTTENNDKSTNVIGSSSLTTQNDESEENNGTGTGSSKAVTNTINERLMAELQQAQDKEKFGARSTTGKRLGLVDGFGRTRKSEDEIKAAIAEARDLNGVNPLVALIGGVFALIVASILWWSTTQVGTWLALHPPQTDVYFVQRAAQVFRNITMGMISLASGFFGVTGLGIFLLGVRVAYGVMTGELDPTPIKPSATAAAAAKEKQDAVDIGRMMDLMTNNKRRGRREGNNDSDRSL